MAKGSIQIREFGSSGKMSKASFFEANLTAGNIAAQVTAITALKTAIADVILGNFGKTEISHLVSDDGGAPAASELAQRENVWLVSARETAGGLNTVTFTIPTAKLSGLLAADGENMLDGAVKSALVTAIEAHVLSNDLVAVNVESIKFRGRTR